MRLQRQPRANSIGMSIVHFLIYVCLLPFIIGASASELVFSNYQFGDLRLSYQPPRNDGGEQITKYKVEWDASQNNAHLSPAILHAIKSVFWIFRGDIRARGARNCAILSIQLLGNVCVVLGGKDVHAAECRRDIGRFGSSDQRVAVCTSTIPFAFCVKLLLLFCSLTLMIKSSCTS